MKEYVSDKCIDRPSDEHTSKLRWADVHKYCIGTFVRDAYRVSLANRQLPSVLHIVIVRASPLRATNTRMDADSS